jgi:hypothetical protein
VALDLDKNGRQVVPSADGKSALEYDGGGQAGTDENALRARWRGSARHEQHEWQEVEEPEEEDYERRPVGPGLRPGM